jgi:hypothetical protein
MFRIQAPVFVIPTADAKLALGADRPPGSRPIARSQWRQRGWSLRISNSPSIA